MDQPRTVADWMALQGINQETLLQSAALDRKIMEAIIQGRYTPSPQQRQRIAAALGVDPADISWDHSAPISHIHGHGPQFGRSP
jgi:hypothetical protein